MPFPLLEEIAARVIDNAFDPSYYGVTMEAQRPALNPYPAAYKKRGVYYHYESNTLRYVDTDEVMLTSAEAKSMGMHDMESLAGTGFEKPSVLQAAPLADVLLTAPSHEGAGSAGGAADGVSLNSIAHPEPDLNPASLETIEIDDPVIEWQPAEGDPWRQWQQYWLQPQTEMLEDLIGAGTPNQLYVSQEPVASWIKFHALKFRSGRIFDVMYGFRGATRKHDPSNDTVRASYRELNYMEKESIAAIKDRAQILINYLNDARRRVEAGLAGSRTSHRQIDIALQRAEECVMWATKALTG